MENQQVVIVLHHVPKDHIVQLDLQHVQPVELEKQHHQLDQLLQVVVQIVQQLQD